MKHRSLRLGRGAHGASPRVEFVFRAAGALIALGLGPWALGLGLSGCGDPGGGGGGTVPADPCAADPCAGANNPGHPNQSVCVQDAAQAAGYRCTCDAGYEAANDGTCQPVAADACDPNPCAAPHQTSCVADAAAPAGYRCACDAGYEAGPDGACEPLAVDVCDPNPCVAPHRTVCAADGAGGVTCSCEDGYLPDQGDAAGGCIPDPGDPCAPNPCVAPFQTVCEVVDGHAACACDPGYQDDGVGGCEPVSLDPCAQNPCLAPHETQCTNDGGFPVCACDTGYHYDALGVCVADDPCAPNPCVVPHKAVCQPTTGGGALCLCDEGYTDDGVGGCEPVSTDPCAPNPCAAPGQTTCVADGALFTCVCDPGYASDGLGGCVLATDPCDPNPCAAPHKTVCEPAGTSFSCACDPGYQDGGAGACEPVLTDPCDPNPCTAQHQTACAPDNGGAVCGCDDGYHEDGQGGCTDDPCAPNPCTAPHQTACSPSGVGVVCGCDAGYQADGLGGCEPEPANPCDPNPCDAPNQGACVPQGDAAVCGCDAGYHDDGQGGCTADPCLPDPCDAPHEGVCAAEPTAPDGYACGCDEGYYPSGPGASGCVDACAAFPCEEPHKQACEALGGAAVCSCDSGFHEDGQGGCTDDPCVPEPCSADEVCQGNTVSGTFACVPCLDGDGDSYGVGPGCAGPDCDDTSVAIHDGCPCPAAHPQGDAYEEDECFFLATPIASGETQDHTVDPAGDVDWLTFPAQAGDMVRLLKLSGGAAMKMTLVDRDGTTDVEQVSATSSSSRLIDRKLPATGDWFVRLQATYATSTGDYQVSLENLGPDDHGDDWQHATPIPLGAADGPHTAGALQIEGNVDWFSVDVPAGHMVQLWAQSSAGTGVNLRLYDVDGVTLLEGDSNSYNSPVMIDRGTLAAGTYYLRVADYYGNSNTGPYEVWAVDLGLDDHGNDALHATPVPLNGTHVPGLLEVQNNVDWFSFDLPEGHMVQVWAQAGGGADGSTGVTLRLYDQDGTSFLEESAASYTGVAMIDRGLLTGGTYYFGVEREYGSAVTGPYEVWAVDLGPNDHGTDAASATPVPLDGTHVPGALEVNHNRDWFSFDLPEGHMVQVWAQAGEGADGSTGVTLRLYDQDGTSFIEESSASWTGAAMIDRGLLSGGTYYFRVEREYGTAVTGPYEVWAVDLGPNDHGDDAAHATPVPLDGTHVPGAFQVNYDRDWFSFDLPQGHMVQVWAQAGEGADGSTGVTLRLYDQDGASFIEEASASYAGAAMIDRGLLGGGTYYFRVEPNYGSAATGPYEVWAVDLGPNDHGDDALHATAITLDGGHVAGGFQVNYDRDWFSFDVPAGHIVALHAQASGGTGVKLRLYDQDGTSFVEESSASYDSAAFIDRGNLDPGTYFLRVEPNYGSASTGAYEVWGDDLGLDDHGDAGPDATPLPTDGTLVDGVIQYGGDKDVFSLAVSEGATYSIVCVSGAGFQCTGSLYDPADSSVVYYLSNGLATWTAPASGTYFLHLYAGSGGGATGDYQVKVTAQ